MIIYCAQLSTSASLSSVKDVNRLIHFDLILCGIT